jgi:ribonuclease BN (tRNA processing enzyme)
MIMKLTFLGTGSAFTVGSNNYHSNMILENDHSQKLLIDCGSDARLSLNELNLCYRDITDVYISHLHADHAGGLEWLAFTTKFDQRCEKPNLFICERLVNELWNNVLSGGLNSLQGQAASLSTFFNVHAIEENGSFYWHKQEIRLLQTLHVMSGFAILPSYGLIFKSNGLNVLITTDMLFSPINMHDFYEMADIIFHDCETNDTKSGVHSHFNELITLPDHIKQKMWLYHYQPGCLPDAVKHGFRGFVRKGQCFDFNDPSSLK